MGNELARIGGALRQLFSDSMVEPISPLDSMSGFRYSYTEVRMQGDGTHVRRSETRLQDGRLVTEECEGMVDEQVYQRLLEQSQRQWHEQMEQAMQLVFMPFWLSGRDR